MTNPKNGDLRVSHIPQVPMQAFHVPVSSREEGAKVMKILADYDLFQFEKNIKPDFCNAQFLEVFDEGEGDWWAPGDEED